MSNISTDFMQNPHTVDQEDSKMLKRIVPKGHRLKVAIVGAGVSGLRAADVLLKHGAKVKIFEARDRVGGRLAQSSQLGHLVDLGPNWIHGTGNNPILDLARQTGTKLHYWNDNQAVFDEDGLPVPENDISETSDIFWGIISDAFQYSNEHSASIPAERSLMEFVKEKVQEKFQDDPPAEREKKQRLVIYEAEQWGAYVGSATATQSLKFLWLEETLEGENPFVADTFQKILEEIAKPAVSQDLVKFGREVTSIETPDRTSAQDSQVTVKLANGNAESFDEVIVTTPLGWLQRHPHAFNPPLPNPLLKSIQAISYGSLDKVYLTFPTAFWDAPPSSSSTPNGTTTTTHHPYADFITFLHPHYSTPTNPHRWSQQSLNLSALPAPHAHPTLVFYVFGPCATHLATLAGSQPALIAFFAPYLALLPNYAPDDPSCAPRAALATAWAVDELAGCGSYCCFRTGLEEGDKDIERMRHGAPERRLWFAGEHTSPFVALGTVTGAYWSGERVAERVLRLYEEGEG